MHARSTAIVALVLVSTAASAFDIDRDTFTLHTVEPPLVHAAEIDYTTLAAEVAHGAIDLVEPEARTTKSMCVPKGSKNKIKDAVEVETHFYRVSYRVAPGVVVIRDGAGAVVHAARLDGVESWRDFGHDQCRYWWKPTLEKDFAEQRTAFLESVRAEARASFERQAGAALDDALFFRERDEKVVVYTFQDKRRDYTDLDEAAVLARTAYERIARTRSGPDADARERLLRAVALWEAALTESDPNDKKARINRKVTAKLYVSIGQAHLVLDDPAQAVRVLERARMFGGMTTSRSDGTGSADLLERARRRQERQRRNAASELDPGELDLLVKTTAAWRGRIPIEVFPEAGLARLEDAHDGYVLASARDQIEAERVTRDEAVAAGEANPYENRVTRTSMQGFVLFLMPFPDKLDSFPVEVCELDFLNQLRLPNHGIAAVPDDIARLTALEVLDLSGNRIDALPDSIGELRGLRKLNLSGNRLRVLPDAIARLESLEVLKLKGNPLADGELARLASLLPDTKIKD